MATVQLASQTPDQALVPGPALQELDLPANSFTGGSGQLTYTATMADGSALPNWLMFLSTPTFGPSFLLDLAAPAKNQFSVMVTAADVATASSATETINFTVAGPVVSDHTPDQTWVVGQKVSLALPADSFNDFGLGLTVKATSLPSWLSFNATTGTFSGTAPATAGTFAVTLVATDAAALSTSESFLISVQLTPSYTPILQIQTPHQTFTQGQFVELDLPAKAFIDTNGTMTYAATLADGSALPAWLMFLSTPSFGPAFLLDLANPAVTANAFAVTLTATDLTSGLSAAENINFTMLGFPTVTDQTAAQVLVPGKTMSFALAADTFTDPQGQSLSLKATGMPGWLAFDATTGTFSGTAPTSAKSFAVTVAATDAIGLSGSETFNVGFLSPPVVAPTAAQNWLPGVLSFTLPADTFTDPNGEALSYAATRGMSRSMLKLEGRRCSP